MTRTRKRALAIVRRFERAFEGYSWRGGGHPDDAPYWEEQYKKERERLVKLLMGEPDPRLHGLEFDNARLD